MKIYGWIKSGPRAQAFILIDGNILPDMSEVAVRTKLWMDIMQPHIDVQICLDIVDWLAPFSELLCSFAHAVRQSFVSRRNPTSLNLCFLFLISELSFVLPHHRRNRLYWLLWNLIEVSCLFSCLIKLWNCPAPDIKVIRPIRSIINSLIMWFFCVVGMLRQRRFEIRSIHENISFLDKFMEVPFIYDFVFGLL